MGRKLYFIRTGIVNKLLVAVKSGKTHLLALSTSDDFYISNGHNIYEECFTLCGLDALYDGYQIKNDTTDSNIVTCKKCLHIMNTHGRISIQPI